jgi:hypothetical protein
MLTRTLIFLALSLPALAFADIAPGPDYVESCTVEKQCKPVEEGLTCGSNHTERDKCEKAYAKDGWVHRCNTRGASVWTEVWCRPRKKK